MIRIGARDIEVIEMALREAAVGARDMRGAKTVLSTLDPESVRRAAIAALVMATGEIVLPDE